MEDESCNAGCSSEDICLGSCVRERGDPREVGGKVCSGREGGRLVVDVRGRGVLRAVCASTCWVFCSVGRVGRSISWNIWFDSSWWVLVWRVYVHECHFGVVEPGALGLIVID